MAQDTGLEFTRADVVVSISRGPPGQWFPENEHRASAIFVGTSGIPPKIIYRSVKSYKVLAGRPAFARPCDVIYEFVLTFAVVSRMSGSSNLYCFRDGW